MMLYLEERRPFIPIATAEKLVYDQLKNGENDVSFIALKCNLTEIQVRVAIQLLVYKRLIVMDQGVPRLKK